MPADSTELLNQSVTRYDTAYRGADDPVSAPAGVLSLYFPALYGRAAGQLPMDLPLRWARRRDYILASTPDHNAMWAAAIAKAISKQCALGWSVEDKAQSERRVERARRILLGANMGSGWVSFLTQHLQDYLLTDNGAFIEIIRSEPHPRARVLGIQHLDSARCTRLNDEDLWPWRHPIAERFDCSPEDVHSHNFPAIYTDLPGRPHLLWRWQVICLVDQESPRIEHRGTGMCAASRAYPALFKDTAMERYVTEKITGNRPMEIHLVNGIQAQQLEGAVRAADEQQKSRGYVQYKGVIVVPAMKMDTAIGGYRIPISEVPDGFEPEKERTNTYLKYANAIGIAIRDLMPAPAGLNSGQTAIVEAESAEGTGLAAWRKQFLHVLNEWVLPESTEFGWDGTNLRDDKDRADIAKVRADTRKVMIDAGEITPAQALQMAVDAGDADDAFLPKDDETPNDLLTDDEKPLDEAEQTEADRDEDGDNVLTLGELLRWRRKVRSAPVVTDALIAAADALRKEARNEAE